MSRPKTSKSIASDIDRTFNANMKLLEESMEGLPKNCKAYLDRLMAKAKLEQSYRFERSQRGIDPPNLGMVQKLIYNFTATVDAEQSKPDAKRQAFEDAMDAEFPMTAAHQRLPEIEKTKKKRTK